MRTIGVLGGIGPQATMDFEAKIHAAARRLVPADANRGYPPLVTVFLRHPPVEVDAEARPLRPLRLDRRVLDAATRLGQWADLLAIPSNTPHLFLDEIRDASGAEVVSIVDVTTAELARRRARTVGLVGLGIPDVYAERFDREGIEYRVATQDARDRLDGAILRLMEGAATDADRLAARQALSQVRGGVDATVLGCTEIPILLEDAACADDLVDPAALLAEEVVRRAVAGAGGL